MSDSSNLTLSEALKNGRLQEFIDKQEGLKIPSVKIKDFEKVVKKAVKKAVKERPPQDQTSGSRARGGSRGK